MEKNVKKLIDYLYQRKQVEHLVIYRSDNDSWYFYYSIRGYLRNDYFHIRISSWGKHCNEIKDDVEIILTTDCKEEVEKILNKFNLIQTNQTKAL
jgi:hypothetical protein